MAEHVWSVLCYKGCLDKFTNQVSLLDVLDRITIEPVEGMEIEAAFPLQADLVSLWYRSDWQKEESTKTRVRLRFPDGTWAPKDYVLEIDLTENPRNRTFVKMAVLPYEGKGVYRFVVEVLGPDGEWRHCASVPLEMKLKQSEPA